MLEKYDVVSEQRLTKQGWQLVSQSGTSAQVRKGRKWSQIGILLFVVLPLLGGCLWTPLFGVALLGLIFVTADYLLRKEQLKYITVEQLGQRRSKAQASKQKSKLAKTINLLVLGVGFGVAAIALILAGGYWLTGSNLLSPEPLSTTSGSGMSVNES